MGTHHRLTRREALAITLAAALLTPALSPAQATPVTDTFPVTVTHTMGDTTIPARPQRVVAVNDYADLDFLLTLGVDPVLYGFTHAWDRDRMPWQGATVDIPQYDASAEVDLEVIVAARPDLILTIPQGFDNWYESLSAIAPTIVLDWDAPWRDGLRMVGRATGSSAAAAAAISETDALLAQARADLAPAAGKPIMVGFQFGDSIVIWGDQISAAQLFGDLGLTVVGGDDPILSETSLEDMTLLREAEILLSPTTDAEGIKRQEASLLFQSLPAVQRGGYGNLDVIQTRALADSVSPISLAWVLPELVPILLQLAAGDGKTLP